MGYSLGIRRPAKEIRQKVAPRKGCHEAAGVELGPGSQGHARRRHDITHGILLGIREGNPNLHRNVISSSIQFKVHGNRPGEAQKKRWGIQASLFYKEDDGSEGNNSGTEVVGFGS